MTALALSGCMQHDRSRRGTQPQSDLDSMAYGQTYAPAPVAVADSGGGGAISALRSAFAAAPRGYCAGAGPGGLCRTGRCRVATTPSYHLDAGDKLRVVVYGQEGLTNTYAIDAAGSITMPLIGAVPARGRTPAGLAAESRRSCATALSATPRSRWRSNAYRPFFILGEVAAPGQYPYVPNMTSRARWRSPAASRHAPSATASRSPIRMLRRRRRFVVPLGTPLSPGDTVLVGERWF